MIKSIAPEICTGCGACVRICPLDALRMGEDKKAFIAYPEDCMTCFLCERCCRPPFPTCLWSLEEAAHEKHYENQPGGN